MALAFVSCVKKPAAEISRDENLEATTTCGGQKAQGGITATIV
jgi:hypothetical protein